MFIDVSLPDRDEVGLAVCNDWHIGNPQADVNAAKSWVDTIKKNGWLVLVLGDMMENATIGSVGSVFEQTMIPQKQIEKVVGLLSPIKDQIIASVPGNHSARTAKISGIDPDAILAYELGINLHTYTASGRIFLGEKKRGTTWNIVAHHGAGGGRLIGNKLSTIKKLAEIRPNCDLYMMGHTHADVAASDRVIVPSNNMAYSERWKTRQYSGCGALLGYEGIYPEAKLLPPTVKAQVVHFLGTDRHTKLDHTAPDVRTKRYRREVFYF